jgi:hypothetical protein
VYAMHPAQPEVSNFHRIDTAFGPFSWVRQIQ